MSTIRGRVILYDAARGFGFLGAERERDDRVFVHARDVLAGAAPLGVGDLVTFEVRATPRGPRAYRVRRVTAARHRARRGPAAETLRRRRRRLHQGMQLVRVVAGLRFRIAAGLGLGA